MAGMEQVALVFLLLAIPLTLGYLCAGRLLRRSHWPSLLGESLALATVLTLVGVNGVCRYLGSRVVHGFTALEVSVAVTLAVLAVLALLILWKASPPPSRGALPKLCTRLLVGLSALVGVYTNAQQIASPDDDFWIHAPLQGLMRHGNFPPFNPFFSDIAMNGHYGRNLGIVTFSLLSRTDVFMSQHLMTSGLQVLTLWLFFSAFRLCTGRWQDALLGTVFVYFGINCGGRGGLIDTMQNNNAFVHLYLALLLCLVVEVWKEANPAAAVLAGVTLGSLAIVYETHFGLCFLVLLSMTPLFLLRGMITRKAAALSALALLVSLPLAFTQGGPLTDILARHRQGRQHTQAENLSRGMQNQAQVVKITFPKKELFQILLETGEYQRVAQIYLLDTPLQHLHKPSIQRGYAYIWSWDVLKIHFLPLYLFPVSLVVLWRRKSMAGHFMGAFGTIAFLVPALVNFGPIYESEYYRWEFAASLGFAGALGLTVASWLWPRPEEDEAPFEVTPAEVRIRRRGAVLIAVAALTLLNSWACLSFVAGRLSLALPGSPMGWLVFPSTAHWLQKHQVLDFGPLDYQAATWLGRQAQPSDRLLTNFSQENNFSILFESTLTGLAGVRCVGHALPLEDEKIGTTPFRRAPAAVAFWQTLRGDPLSQLQVDWLYYRNDHGEELPPLPGAQLMHRVQEGEQLRLIYRINRTLLPDVGVPNGEPAAGPALRAELEGAPPVLRGGRTLDLALQAGGEAKKVSGVLELSTVRKSDGLISSPSENLRWRVDAGKKGVFPAIPFVPPYDDGLYTLKGTWFPDQGTRPVQITEGVIDVGFTRLVEQVKIEKTVFPGGDGRTFPPEVLLTPRVFLRLPANLPEDSAVLACWAFYSVGRKEFDALPGTSLQQVSLSDQPLELSLITPERPGSYRLALYLSARQGHLTRVPLGMVTIAGGGESR